MLLVNETRITQMLQANEPNYLVLLCINVASQQNILLETYIHKCC